MDRNVVEVMPRHRGVIGCGGRFPNSDKASSASMIAQIFDPLLWQHQWL